MKKTIAALALGASSSSAFALMPPPIATKTICLAVAEDANGVQRATSCDASANNVTSGVPLLANGCAEDQVSLVALKFGNRYNINIASCLPPNVTQL